MIKKCSNCRLVNYPDAILCARCDTDLAAPVVVKGKRSTRFLVRAAVCLCVCLAALFGFYLSLIASAKSLTLDEKQAVRAAIQILKDKGFSREAMMLENFTVYRSNDNWLNASVEKENAYAATNFPFEIMTLYPEFFTIPVDDSERAAILLHEARHLQGKDEEDAYRFVWKNRQKFGWTQDAYNDAHIWKGVRKQTREYAPDLFVCEQNEFSDCTE